MNTEINKVWPLAIKQLTGATLNWAVAKSLGKLDQYAQDHAEGNGRYHLYSTDLELGGEIIEKHKISTMYIHENLWLANNAFDGRTHIEAAMRFFVWEHLGDEVDVPFEQYEYETEIARIGKTIDQLSPEVIYAMRVEQLENEGMTTSDAQGCADYEDQCGTLESNVLSNLDKQPFSYPIQLPIIQG